MAPVAFFAASILAIAGAIGVISLGNAFYNVLALVVHLIALAALFLLLRAEFVAAAAVRLSAGRGVGGGGAGGGLRGGGEGALRRRRRLRRRAGGAAARPDRRRAEGARRAL